MSIIQFTDLTSITRDADKAHTRVRILEDKYEPSKPWLDFGELQLRNEGRICWLAAYLSNGVTDFEHDSAYALRLPIIGLRFEAIMYHTTYITAWVDPDGTEDFNVPRPGYNPAKHPESVMCNSEYCVREPHIIVPQGFYVPPFDEELFEAVRGKKLEITVGLRRESTE